jgi:nicotinamidase-related amidase
LRLAPDTLLVVIDAQRAFVDPAGSLPRAYGLDEVQPGVKALVRLLAYIAQAGTSTDAVFVRSEYRPGQFTDGRLDDPLANLCAPGRNVDCEWATGLDTTRASAIITKRQADAGEADAYRAIVERAVREGTRQILLAGFQFTTCVRASALTTLRLVSGSGTEVVVAEALAGARASSYKPADGGSRVEATRRELRAAGVLVAAGVDQAV